MTAFPDDAVDAHQHFWRLSRGDYGWLTPDLAPLYRDFEPGDLQLLLDEAGIRRTVVVQAAPTVAETEFLLELAAETGFVAGVVGWVDMAARDATATLERLAANPFFKGIRPMIQDIEDPDWMLRSALTPTFEALADLDLAFDALVLPRHLPNLLTLLRRHPRLRAVIDHAAKPDIATGALEPWRTGMRRLADETAALCKLSGLLTEAGERATPADLEPYTAFLLEAFGPGRLAWGSDWPVLALAGDYAGWLDMTVALLEGVSADDLARIAGRNARQFYRLE